MQGPMACFTGEGNPSLANPPLKLEGSEAKLTPIVK